MTTKPKEHDLRVKEKRGTSPSFPPTQQRRKSLNGSGPAAAAAKQVPTYLKSTQSSRLDPSSSSSSPTIKKQQPSTTTTTTTTTDKPNHLTRRRSFDKPPSLSSRIPKPQTSLKSSSFSSKKTNPLTKSHLEKVAKATKDVGKNSTLTRKSNGTTTTYNNKKPNNASSAKGVVKRTSTTHSTVMDCSVPEPEEKYQESFPTEVEEINYEMNIQAETHKPEDVKERDEEIINEEEFDEGKEQLNLSNSSTVTQDHSSSLLTDKEDIDKHENDQIPAKENGSNDNNHQEMEQNKKEECYDDILGNEKNESDEEKKKIIEEVESVSSKEEVVEGTKEATKCEETPQVEKVNKVISQVVKKSQGGGQGKKDTTAYNDVIEETASKLREQRKNKVKALVGAFETVISLESDE